MGTTKIRYPWATTLGTIDAVADLLHARRIDHNVRGGDLGADCPACGKTGRPGRRPVGITERLDGGLVTRATCRCSIVSIARALDVHPSFLMKPRVVERLPDARRGPVAAGKAVRAFPASAKPWGVTLDGSEGRSPRGQRNLKAIRRVADDLARAFATVAEGEWKSYGVARAAADLDMDPTSIRRALRWLVKNLYIEVRQLPAPGEKVVTARGDAVAKSGVKQYRPLNERQQIRLLSRRATWAEMVAECEAQSAARAARIAAAWPALRRGGEVDLVVDRVQDAEPREQDALGVDHLDVHEPVRDRVGHGVEPKVVRVDEADPALRVVRPGVERVDGGVVASHDGDDTSAPGGVPRCAIRSPASRLDRRAREHPPPR